MQKCFRFLSLILTVLVMGQTLLGEGHQMDSHLSVRQQVDSILYNLKSNLSGVKQDGPRFELLSRAEKDIHSLRQRSPLQFRTDEQYLNAVAKGIQELSSGSDFSFDSCDKHRAYLMKKPFAKLETKASAATMEILTVVCH